MHKECVSAGSCEHNYHLSSRLFIQISVCAHIRTVCVCVFYDLQLVFVHLHVLQNFFAFKCVCTLQGIKKKKICSIVCVK